MKHHFEKGNKMKSEFLRDLMNPPIQFKTEKMEIKTMFVTPEKAMEFLERNIENNRNCSERAVNAYTRDMRSGSWKRNGDTIKFCSEGNLIDGQHRLQAIIRSGVPILMDIAFGIEKDAFKTIDKGKKRTTADVFKTRGESNTTRLATLIIWLERWKKRNPVPKNLGYSLTANEFDKILNENPDLRIAAGVNRSNKIFRGMCNPTICCFAFFLFSRKDELLAQYFYEQLKSGAGLQEGHPILLLRERMRRMTASRYSSPDYDFLALLILAWNYIRIGKTKINKLYWNESSGTFPEPK